MALSKMSWDELNQLVGRKISEPFDEYYAPIQISEKQKQRRIELAEQLYILFVGLLSEYFYANQLDTIVSSDIFQRTQDEYMDIIYMYLMSERNSGNLSDEFILSHAASVISDTITVLLRHSDEPFYYSEDRAMAIAEGDSHSIWNHTEFEEAVKRNRNKTWNTVMDGKERESHAEVNGLTIPINEPFELQGGYVMYPRDTSLGASDSEIISCRCSLSFS